MKQSSMSYILYAVVLLISGHHEYLYDRSISFLTLSECESFYYSEEPFIKSIVLESAASYGNKPLVISEIGCGLLTIDNSFIPLIVLHEEEGISL